MLFLLIACQPEPESKDPVVEAVDERVTDAPDAPEGGMQFVGADVIIPAYSGHEYCLFGTYEGPDMGIYQYDAYQGTFGHHVLLLQSFADPSEYPDGTVTECSSPTDETMINVQPFVVAPTFGSGTNLFHLPDGMAASIHSGDRYMIQSHYVNTSEDDIRVQDVINLGLMDPETVTTWTASIVFTQSNFTLPAQQKSTISFDCTMEDPYNVLYLFGHMHEWGTSMSFSRVVGEAVNPVFEVNPWMPEYRDAPPVEDFMADPLVLSTGDVLRTVCNWNNDTDRDMSFPEEMCASAGMAYPAKVPIICSD